MAEICRKAGISQATYFNWKKKYDGLLPSEMRRLKQLEHGLSGAARLVVVARQVEQQHPEVDPENRTTGLVGVGAVPY